MSLQAALHGVKVSHAESDVALAGIDRPKPLSLRNRQKRQKRLSPRKCSKAAVYRLSRRCLLFRQYRPCQEFRLCLRSPLCLLFLAVR